MSKIIAIHAFRRGSGKSTMGVNLAALMARSGLRVGMIDANMQSPSLHLLLGLSETDIGKGLNHYLRQEATIKEVIYDVSGTVKPAASFTGAFWLVPASDTPEHIATILRDGFEMSDFNQLLHDLTDELALDVLLIDTISGLMDIGMMSLAVADGALIVLRPDQQDYYGTAMTVELVQELAVSRSLILVNETPKLFEAEMVRSNMEQIFKLPVAAVLPFYNELMALGSRQLFALTHPDHDLTRQLQQIADQLLAD